MPKSITITIYVTIFYRSNVNKVLLKLVRLKTKVLFKRIPNFVTSKTTMIVIECPLYVLGSQILTQTIINIACLEKYVFQPSDEFSAIALDSVKSEFVNTFK